MKNYYNKNIHDLIEKNIKKLEIDEDFKPYVIDILMRRAYQFGFTTEEIQTDLATLNNSLKSIQVGFINFNTAGQYSSLEKRIKISLDASIKQSYSTLAHELFHACTRDENGNDRLGGYNYYSKQYNYCLLEAFIERTAHRLVYNTKPKNPYSNLNATGYGNIVFIIDMLCATYGVKENDLLKNGIQSREKLIDFLSEKSGNNNYHTKEVLDMIEMNYTVIHNAFYEKKKQKRFDRGKNVSEALGNISKLCFDEMNLRFAHINFEDLSPEVFENIKFDYNKLNTIIDRECSNFFINPSLVGFSESRVAELIEEESLAMKNGIIQTEHLTHIGLENISEQIKSCLSWSRWGNIDKMPLVVNESVPGLPKKVNSRTNFDISKEVIDRNTEFPEVTDSWDNSIINSKYRFTFIKKILQIPIDKIKRFFPKKMLSLPEPSYEYTKNTEQNHSSWELKDDELEKVRKFDEQLKETSEGKKNNTTVDSKEKIQDDEMEK